MIIDDDYLGSSAISQSKLKRILGHPKNYLEDNFSEDDEPADAILIGDAVDMLITQGEDKFQNKFFVATQERPTAQMGEYVWNLFINRLNSNASEIAYNNVGFKRDTLAKVEERFKTEGKPYYDELVAAQGKTVITPTQFNTIQLIKRSLCENKFTSKFLLGSDRYLVSYQVPIYFSYEGNSCKGLIDVLCYDRVKNQLYPIDIKTTASSLNGWEFNFVKFRYDFQAAFYMEGLSQMLLSEYCEGNTPTLMPFRFIVESQKFPGSPLIFELSEDTLNVGKFGGLIQNRQYEGFESAIKRLSWHIETDLWDYRMEDYLNKGVRVL